MEQVAKFGDDAVGSVINYGGEDALIAMQNGIEPSLISELDSLGIKTADFEGFGIVSDDIAEASEYAVQATKIPLSNEVVLGRDNLNGISYVDIAKSRGTTYFELDNWDEVAQTFGNDNMWLINEQFLNEQWYAGKEFFFSHNPLEAEAGSYFEREVLHLIIWELQTLFRLVIIYGWLLDKQNLSLSYLQFI